MFGVFVFWEHVAKRVLYWSKIVFSRSNLGIYSVKVCLPLTAVDEKM